MGLSLTGSDWRGEGRKADNLLCIIVIIILSLPDPEAEELRDCVATSSWWNWEGQPIYRGGRGNITGEVCKIVHAPCLPQPSERYPNSIWQTPWIPGAQTVAAQLQFGMEDSGKEDGSRKDLRQRWRNTSIAQKKQEKTDCPLHHFGQRHRSP